jgi:hypothetical protein
MSKSQPLSLEEKAINQIFSEYKYRAGKKGLEFSLTKERFTELIQLPCYYNQEKNSNNKNGFRYNGIDRIDSSKGYVEGNVVPCCKNCNCAKNEMKKDSFFAWAIKIARKIKEKIIGTGTLRELDDNSLEVLDELTLDEMDYKKE